MSSKPTIDRRQTLQGMAAGAALAAGWQIPTSAAQGADEGTPDAAEASLYERLGGYFAIAAVVDRFSDEIIKNPKLNVNPALTAWNETEAAARLPGLKFGRTFGSRPRPADPSNTPGYPWKTPTRISTSPPRNSKRLARRSSALWTISRPRNAKSRNLWTPTCNRCLTWSAHRPEIAVVEIWTRPGRHS